MAQGVELERIDETAPASATSAAGREAQATIAGPVTGLVRFVEPAERARMCAEFEDAGLVVARLEAIAVTSRGKLDDTIAQAVDRALYIHGGRAGDSLEARIACALEIDTPGIAVMLGSLRALVDEDGALEAKDSRTVRHLARATRTFPLVLVLDAADANLSAYADPSALASIIAPATPASCDPPAPEPTAPTPIAAPPALPTTASSARSPLPAPAPEPAFSPEPAPVVSPEPAVFAAPSRRPHLPPPEVWHPWVVALAAARGPQPLAAFEKLFAASYMPLARAIEMGLEDARAIGACDEFRRTFARAYGEACPTFAVTGKRPRMVFDAPDVASRIARLHGARTTQLLLVDGMRFDLGLRVRDHLVRELGARASLAEELLLWSALPSTTGRQLELLARGIEGMRAAPESEREADPLRGRTTETIRRVKIGHRDVFKLDLVQARLADSSDHESLAEVPAQVAEAIARHARTLSSRTLLFVFGDHGFVLGDAALAPPSLTGGGASPEEVLVGAFAFLVGAVH